MSARLVLASASPARRMLLQRSGINPTIMVSDVDETAALAAAETQQVLAIEDAALVLARAKAEAVCRALAGHDEDQFVLGCDSMLEFDGARHGKPGSPEEAIARWRRLRGNSGTLHTGHWLVDERSPERGGTGGVLGATASTVVHFGEVSDAEIEAYVATGEPLHVAGAFTLDGLGAPLIDGIEGDPSNVIGLSLPLLRHLLAELGVAWADLASSNSLENS